MATIPNALTDLKVQFRNGLLVPEPVDLEYRNTVENPPKVADSSYYDLSFILRDTPSELCRIKTKSRKDVALAILASTVLTEIKKEMPSAGYSQLNIAEIRDTVFAPILGQINKEPVSTDVKEAVPRKLNSIILYVYFCMLEDSCNAAFVAAKENLMNAATIVAEFFNGANVYNLFCGFSKPTLDPSSVPSSFMKKIKALLDSNLISFINLVRELSLLVSTPPGESSIERTTMEVASWIQGFEYGKQSSLSRYVYAHVNHWAVTGQFDIIYNVAALFSLTQDSRSIESSQQSSGKKSSGRTILRIEDARADYFPFLIPDEKQDINQMPLSDSKKGNDDLDSEGKTTDATKADSGRQEKDDSTLPTLAAASNLRNAINSHKNESVVCIDLCKALDGILASNNATIQSVNTAFADVLEKYIRSLKEELLHSDQLLRATLSYLDEMKSRAEDRLAVLSLDGRIRQYLQWHSTILLAAKDPNEIMTGDFMKLAGILTGHSAHVTAIATSPADPYLILTSSGDKTINVLVLTHERINRYGIVRRKLIGHTDVISDIAISPDCNYAVSCSADKTLRLWDIHAGDCIHVYDNLDNQGHTSAVQSVAFSKDGSQIVSVASDKTIKTWSMQGECTRTIQSSTQPPSAKLLVNTGWDLVQDQSAFLGLIGRIPQHNVFTSSPDVSLYASADSRTHYADSRTHYAMVWTIPDCEILLAFPGLFRAMAFSSKAHNNWLAVASDSRIRVCDVQSGKLFGEISLQVEGLLLDVHCFSLAWSSDGQELFAGFSDGTVKVYSVGPPTYGIARVIQELRTKYPDFPLSQYLQSSTRIELGWCPKLSGSSHIPCVQIFSRDSDAIAAFEQLENALKEGPGAPFRLLVSKPEQLNELSSPPEPWISESDLQRLKLCYEWACDNLFTKHSNLVGVKMGYKWIKGSEKWDTEPGIVLFVVQKGFIPLGEDELPRYINVKEDAYATVSVREGFVKHCADQDDNEAPPKERKLPVAVLKNSDYCRLLPGSSVGVEVSHDDRTRTVTCGTLGGFVTDSNKILYGITNHHVLMTCKCCVPGHMPDAQPAKELYQPANRDLRHKKVKTQVQVGNLAKSFMDNHKPIIRGFENKIWIDAALITIKKGVNVTRSPTFDDFEEFDYDPTVVGVEEAVDLMKQDAERTVVMVSRAGQREGTLMQSYMTCSFYCPATFCRTSKCYDVSDGGFTKSLQCDCNVNANLVPATVYNQYLVLYEASAPAQGDSGSIVYLMEEKNGKKTARPLGLHHSAFTEKYGRVIQHYGICSPLPFVLDKLGGLLEPPSELSFV